MVSFFLPLPISFPVPRSLLAPRSYRSATQSDVIGFTARHGITFLSYSPFGVPDYHNYTFPGAPAGNQLEIPALQQLAQK